MTGQENLDKKEPAYAETQQHAQDTHRTRTGLLTPRGSWALLTGYELTPGHQTQLSIL